MTDDQRDMTAAPAADLEFADAAVAQALAREITARGGSLSEHPKVGEAVMVIVESDAGTTIRTSRLVKDGGRIEIRPHEDQFEPVGGRVIAGVLSNFHVPGHVRSRPGARLFADAMRTIVRTERLPIERADAPTAN